MSRDDNVVGVSLGDARGNGAYAAFGNQFNANRSARIDALKVVDELGQVFDRVDIVMRRRTDELHAGLRVTQPSNQLGDLVTRKLAAFTRLGSLRDLDLDLFGVDKIFRRNAKAGAGNLLDLVIQQRGSAIGLRIGGWV